MSDIRFRATAARPCPVCGAGSKGCSATADGLHFCRGEARAGWKQITRTEDGNGFHHYRREDEPRERDPAPRPAPKPARNWRAEAERCARDLTGEHREALATELGLPAACLAAFPLLGYLRDPKYRDCWTFPECDADGRVVALCRRLFDPREGEPSKPVVQGGSRGLYVPAGWRERSGPVLIPEGASDVLALTACGLSAVGRPNNSGGAELLAELLRGVDREIVVLGEDDRKKDTGQWPGGEGQKVADKLAAALNRPVRFALPAGGAKDARVWVRRLAQKCGGDWAAAGREVLAALRPPSRFKFIDAEEFRRTDYRVDWFVDWFLARGQPAVVAGPSKGMKTSILVDLAVSIATATPHLGKWPVSRPARVAVVSGESGGAALQETFFRVLRAKGLGDGACDGWLKWEFTLPTFADRIDTADFADQLGALDCELVLIDPFYLTLGDIDAKNMFEMGRALRAVCEQLLAKHGVTPVIAHHANRQMPVGEPMELTHLAYAGLEQ